MSQILSDFTMAQPAALDALSAALRRKYRIQVSPSQASPPAYESFHAIDFDGAPPKDAAPESVARLDSVLKEISDRILSDCRRNVALQSNRLLIVATWGYGRCPIPL
jgi:hypothetical protein